MSVTICHASIDERGKAKSGAAGDQTGREVCTRAWYSKPWDTMLRYKDASIAKKAAEIAKKLAKSNLVGYDQYQRNTLYQALKKNNWDVDKYIKSGVKTETDCSAFMYACYCCLIPEMRSNSNAPVTSNMVRIYKKHGFTAYTDKKYTASEDNLQIGDVLVKSSAHTVMAITTAKSEEKKPATPVKPATKIDKAKSKDAKYAGVYKVTASSLNMRAGAGTNKTVLVSIPKGKTVKCFGEFTTVEGTPWLLVEFNGQTGFCSSKYLKK